MGELVVDMFLTLDGVVQGPGGPDEDRADGFTHGGWQAPFGDEESGKSITDNIGRMDALLLGRKTYDIFAGYWPQAPVDPISTRLNAVPKYVASRTLDAVSWENSTLLDGEVSDAVARIKDAHREVHTIGSADLVQTLLRHDLVDRFELVLYPVLLGTGKRLFAEGTVPSALELVASDRFPGGGIGLSYRRAGKPTYGNMADAG
jgi:dihydrofolate reductase